MSSTNESTPADATPHAAVVARPARSRRKPMLIALGIALVLVGGLGAWWITSQTAKIVAVLQVSANVDRGQIITAENLTTLNIGSGQDTDAYLATDADEVVGQTALVDLPDGSILTPANTGDAITVPEGDSIVGLELDASRLPSRTLTAGDSIRVVETPTEQGDPPIETPRTFKGTVFTSKYNPDKDVWLVDIIVSAPSSADVASRAATGRVALVLDSAGD